MRIPANALDALRDIVGADGVLLDLPARAAHSADSLERVSALPDVVVVPSDAAQVARVMQWCVAHRVPLTPRGGGTGYSGGAVPVLGGVVLSMARFTRILEIDEHNLLAVVEPNVITADLQAAVEARGLFYPPDPQSMTECAIGGNIAENAGGPRAFKYGVTRQYVLGLEVVLPTGERIETGGRTVKNVVGYDLTQLLIGSEGTLGIITRATLRLIPKPEARATLQAAFPSIAAAARAVDEFVVRRVVPATIEIIDGMCLDAVERLLDDASLHLHGIPAMLLVDVDGSQAQVAQDLGRADDACRAAGATWCRVATDADEREHLWAVRRQLSPALKMIAPYKVNNDIVVPKGRIPELFALVTELRERYGLPIPSFGHAGDGNIHVNVMVPDPGDARQMERAEAAQADLFDGVIALGGVISGEHGIGVTKSAYIGRNLSADAIALMKRVKQAFDPHGLLNPGKIFPE